MSDTIDFDMLLQRYYGDRSQPLLPGPTLPPDWEVRYRDKSNPWWRIPALLLQYPYIVASRAGLTRPLEAILPEGSNPYVPAYSRQDLETLYAVHSLGRYQPGPRKSEHVEDRRPASIWSWPR